MTERITAQELMQLSHDERREYIRTMHNETMANLNRINRIADDEIKLINQIVNK